MQSYQQTCQIIIQVDVRINKVKGNRGVYTVHCTPLGQQRRIQRLGNRGVYSAWTTEANTASGQQRRVHRCEKMCIQYTFYRVTSR